MHWSSKYVIDITVSLRWQQTIRNTYFLISKSSLSVISLAYYQRKLRWHSKTPDGVGGLTSLPILHCSQHTQKLIYLVQTCSNESQMHVPIKLSVQRNWLSVQRNVISSKKLRVIIYIITYMSPVHMKRLGYSNSPLILSVQQNLLYISYIISSV